MTIFFVCCSLFLCTVGEFQDFFGSIIIQSFSFCFHSLLQAWDALFFLGGDRKSLDFCFDGSEKIVLLFVVFYLLFCC